MAKTKKQRQPIRKPRIAKGDTVIVRSGRDAGQTGAVLKVFPARGAALVEGVNVYFRHARPSEKNPQGGRIKKEMPVHLSNLMVVGDDKQPSLVGRKEVDSADGGKRRVRYLKRSGQELG